MSNSLFDYNDGRDVIPKNAFRISPSQLSKFFDSTNEWYRENLLGEKGFEGSTATYLGTAVHAGAEYWTEHKDIPELEIIKFIQSIDNPEVDKGVIESQWRGMLQTLIDNYLKPMSGTTVETEKFVWYEFMPGIGVGGSIDRYDVDRHRIIDFKTMGSLDKARVPTSFPRPYYFQQMAYAWVMQKLGYKVDMLSLVYVSRENIGRTGKTGKPLKDYPSEVNVVNFVPTQHDYDLIESVIFLIGESVTVWNEKPECRHILAQDMRLKAKPKPKLFKE